MRIVVDVELAVGGERKESGNGGKGAEVEMEERRRVSEFVSPIAWSREIR